MIEQLPHALVLRQQLDDAAHQTQLGADVAARPYAAQQPLVVSAFKQCAPHPRHHRERNGHQREHPRPCFDALDARLGEAQQPLAIAKAFFDGLITNDKFCFTRHRQLKLNWWRRPLHLRQSPLLKESLTRSGGDRETAVEHPAADHWAQRRSTPPRSGLSTPSAMGAGTIHPTTHPGGEP